MREADISDKAFARAPGWPKENLKVVLPAIMARSGLLDKYGIQIEKRSFLEPVF
jgi:hypothetical protein